jgi:acylphosphatase
MRRERFAVVALAAGLALAGEVQAQPDLEIEVADRGTALSGIQISQFVDGIKTRKGATDASGQATIADAQFDFADGATVSVWVRRCEDGEVEIVLVAEGEDDPCVEDDAAAGEDCGCERIGAFVWGGGPVRIDIGAGTVTQGVAGVGTSALGGNLTFGVGFDLRQMLELEDVAGRAPGAMGVDATAFAPGFQLFGEYLFLSMLAFGIEAAYSRMETETRLAVGVLTGNLDYYELGGSAKLGAPRRGPIWPFVVAGLVHSWNHMDFEQDGLSEHRLHKTWRAGLGAGVDYLPAPTWGLRFEGLYNTTFDDEDADEHIRWKLGLMYLPMF